jgi:Family of unknown function (DUF6169)
MQYQIEYINNENNSYIFKTAVGIYYEIQFKPSYYLLGVEKVYAKYIYEFVIEVIENPTNKNPPLDKNIPLTISVIVRDFYYKKNQSVCIYICDSSDGKQEIRRRKFDDWFYSEDIIGLVKVDEKIVDSKGNIYPISLILLNTNKYFAEIVYAFSQIASSNSK